MKLLFVIKALSLPGGGAERVLADVTARLADTGHDVCIASFDPSGSTDFYEFHPRVQRIRLGIGAIGQRSGWLDSVQRLAALRRAALRLEADAAIGFMHSAYVPLALALAGSGVTAIGSEHIVYSHYRDRPLERMLLSIAVPFLYAVTAISEDMRRGFPWPVRRRMTIIANPVAQHSGCRADVVGGARKVLLSVGRLEAQKDHRTLIAAFGSIAGKFPEWILRIVGEGMLRPQLELQVRELGLQGRVEMPGATPDVAGEYARAQLFVVPSSYESFGLATAEALAHGLPAVGFADCPGTNELIEDGISGLLVSGADRVAALAHGLSRFMESAELRQRAGAQAPRKPAMFAPEVVAQRWADLITAAVRRQPAKHFFVEQQSVEAATKQ